MRKHRQKQKGIALFVAMVFVAIFSAVSVGLFNMSSRNTIVASNLHEANQARANAESGLEVIRHYMDSVEISGLTAAEDRFEDMATQLISIANDSLGTQLAYSHLAYSEPHFHLGNSSSPITLGDGESFYARITPDTISGTDWVEIEITGVNGDMKRTITTRFTYGVHETSVLDYGVASKGPLSLGNLLVDGVNVSVEADVYIESLSSNNALDISNAQIAGDVKIVNPSGSVTMSGGQSSIGGETGSDAINNHVEVGVDQADFPTPNPTYFEKYVNGNTIDSSTDPDSYKTNAVLENVRIAAGTNPKFTGDTQIRGILYIESPNVVEFGGNVDITGLVVAEGDYTDNTGTNQIDFQGTVSSNSVNATDEDGNYLLADSKFDGIQGETGTFLMAPGFATSFGGNFDTLNGCIVANGVKFTGNAGGEIGGSIINYSTEPMELSGSDLLFNRSGITDVPAGLIPEVIIHYDPSGYSETP